MYNSKRFEESAFEIYISGMHDYESICETLFMQKYDDVDEIQDILDEAQRIFEERVGLPVTKSYICDSFKEDDLDSFVESIRVVNHSDKIVLECNSKTKEMWGAYLYKKYHTVFPDHYKDFTYYKGLSVVVDESVNDGCIRARVIK